MFPEGFKQRILDQKYIDAEALLKALEEPSPVTIRINPSKWNKRPLNAEPVHWCETGFYLAGKPSYTLDPLFHSGNYYPQEASGMFIGEIFRQVTAGMRNIKVLDLCAAPGGKSTHISTIIGDNGLLVANDAIRTRAAILAENITKWGAANTIVTQNDPAAFGRLEEYFDVVVVDAPCSGEGMFRNPEVIGEWTPANAALCSERQKRILMNVWPALKEKGILVYSTCTFNPSENEENVKWFLDKNDASGILLDIDRFKNIREIKYDGITGYGFHPDKVRGEGFFAAVMRKNSSIKGSLSVNRIKAEKYLSKDDFSFAKRWSVSPASDLFKHSGVIYALPVKREDFAYLQKNLRIIRGGVVLCTVKKNDYIPSCELALSQLLRKGAFPVCELDYRQAVSYLRRDNLILSNCQEGWMLVTYKGVNLGFIKNIGSRINNYFPVNWRIKMDILSKNQDNLIKWTD